MTNLPNCPAVGAFGDQCVHVQKWWNWSTLLLEYYAQGKGNEPLIENCKDYLLHIITKSISIFAIFHSVPQNLRPFKYCPLFQ